MKADKLNELLEIGFTHEKKQKYFFKEIEAEVFEGYIFFRYCNMRLPIIDEVDNIKHLIKGIYNINIL